MNFNEWAKANPTKSLNDYYQEMAAPEPPPTQTQYIETPPKRNYSTLVTIAATVVFCILAVFFYADYQQRQTHLMKKELMPVDADKPIYTANEVQQKIEQEKEMIEKKQGLENERRMLQRNFRNFLTVTNDNGIKVSVLRGGLKDIHLKVTNNFHENMNEIYVLMIIKRGLFKDKPCGEQIVKIENIARNETRDIILNHFECGSIVESEIVGLKCDALKVFVNPYR
jgi:hypothetical protein